MIRKLSLRLSVALLMLFTVKVAFSSAVFFEKPDTLNISVHVQPYDTCEIGPDRLVTGKLYVPGDEELLRFSDLLSQFVVPVKGKVISKYGIRRGRMHTGTDLKLNLYDTVYAAFSGEVFRACRYYGYGNLVIVKHPHCLETYYGHLSKFLVKPGDTVRTGQPVGLGGRTGRATGVHLHFEIRENRVAYNPELVYDFGNFIIRDDIADKERMADLITNPKTGENITLTARGNSYVQEMSTGQVIDYVIKAGDSLWVIARKFNTSVASLCQHNNLTTRSVLKIGKVLKVTKQ